MKTHLMKLFFAAGLVMVVGCGGPMESETPADVSPQVAEDGNVSQFDVPVCGSGLTCSGTQVSGSHGCVQTPGSTRVVYCCPSGQRIYHNDAGHRWCA